VRVRYNAPVILTFTLPATGVLVVDQFLNGFAQAWFACPPRLSDAGALDYLRLGGFCGSLFGFLFTRRGRSA
jgi:hypothetical protein